MTDRQALATRLFGPPPKTEQSELIAAVSVLAEEVHRREELERPTASGSFDGGVRGPVDAPLDVGAEMNAGLREAAQRRSGVVRRADRDNVTYQAGELRPPAGSIEEER